MRSLDVPLLDIGSRLPRPDSIPRLSSRLAGVSMFVFVLLVYILTTPASLPASDSAELTTVVSTWGIAHPPGYPLYTLIGHAFVSIPLGDVPFRLNLMSACFGAAAVLGVFLIVQEQTRNDIAALVGGLGLAFSYHFWAQSLVAEVYSLDAVLVVAVL